MKFAQISQIDTRLIKNRSVPSFSTNHSCHTRLTCIYKYISINIYTIIFLQMHRITKNPKLRNLAYSSVSQRSTLSNTMIILNKSCAGRRPHFCRDQVLLQLKGSDRRLVLRCLNWNTSRNGVLHTIFPCPWVFPLSYSRNLSDRQIFTEFFRIPSSP